MTVRKHLSLDVRVNPPVAPVSEDYVEVSVALTIRGQDLVEEAPHPAQVIGVLVGEPPADVLDSLANDLGIVFLDGDGQLKPAAEITQPVTTLSAGLGRFSQWIEGSGAEDCHLFLFVSTSTLENGDRLGERVEALRNLDVRADIFGTRHMLDYRLLGQVALMCGGRFYVGADRWCQDATLCLERQRSRRFFKGRLGISLTSNLIPVSAFRLDPAPLHVRDFQVQPTNEMCWFDLPVMGSPQDETIWLLRCLAPRRKSGEYRILDYQVMGQTSGSPITMSGTISQSASASPSASSHIDAVVEVYVDRTRAAHWVETVGQAYVRGDGGKIVSTFGPFMQHESLNGRPDNVQRLWSLKGELIRGGYFGLKELNTMWCLAQSIELEPPG